LTDLFHRINDFLFTNEKEEMLTTLKYMLVASIRARDYISDEELDNITDLYLNWGYFYESLLPRIQESF